MKLIYLIYLAFICSSMAVPASKKLFLMGSRIIELANPDPSFLNKHIPFDYFTEDVTKTVQKPKKEDFVSALLDQSILGFIPWLNVNKNRQ
ncbi:hypothetical protein L596_026665 [Steinernema carpocapsae]|uniref:Uncharacterized protein n=1 Tax=Steinernema carpocapsae TaxID=34508 RepID=A0A4U5M220_STECR|nr:hypothetical protein L596_026665 [Steinernema carpocapsae]